MPTLRDLGLTTAPAADPWTYPGDVIRDDALLAGDRLHPLLPGDGPPERRTLRVDDGPLADLGPACRLADALRRLGAAPLTGRHAVLAVGSNGSPAQLRAKFAGSASGVVVLTGVTVTGLAVAHSAHVSRAGYVPYTPVLAPGACRRLVVLHLDDEQLRRLDATEPNYERVPLDGVDVSVVRGTGPPLTGCEVYRGRRGLLRPGPGSAPFAATSQERLLTWLIRRPWFADVVPAAGAGPRAAVAALRRDGELRDAVRVALAEQGHRAPGWTAR